MAMLVYLEFLIPGFYSTMAAASNHPALKAVSPQAPVTNWFIGDDFHHNGAFFQMDAFDFYSALGSGFGQPHPEANFCSCTFCWLSCS